MSNNTKGNLLLIVMLTALLITVFVVNKNKKPPVLPEIVMTQATQTVLEFSPTASSMWKDISTLQRENKLDITIKDGDLSGNVLGQTSINIENDKIICNIIIDVDKARLAGDRVEPLLAHELKHVWDALFLYDKKDPKVSTSIFITTVERDKQISHNNREVELSAIATEDKVRAELSKVSGFFGMPTTRAMADIKFTTRSKIEGPLLKKALLD